MQLSAFVNISLVCLSLVSCNPIDEPGGGGNNGSGNNSSNNGDNGSGDKKLTLEAVDMGLPSGLLWANKSLLDLNYRYTADTYKNRFAFAWGRVSPQESYSEHYYLEEDIENISGNVKYDAATTERVLELGGDPEDDSGNRKGEVCIVDNGKVCFCKIDYLEKAEAVFVETDPRIIQEMYGA